MCILFLYYIYIYINIQEKFVPWGCSHRLRAIPSPAFPLVGAKVAEKISWSSVPREEWPSGRVPGGKSSPRRDRFGCKSPDECPGSQGLSSCLARELLRNSLQAHHSFGSLWLCLWGDTRDRWDNKLIPQPSPNLRNLGFLPQVEVELKEKQGFCMRNTWGDGAPQGLSFILFYFLMERVKLVLMQILHEYLLLVQVLSWLWISCTFTPRKILLLFLLRSLLIDKVYYHSLITTDTISAQIWGIYGSY